MQSKTAKRIPAKQPKNKILSVTIRHILDTDPDTSYLGHYTSKIESDYTIDRRHTRECAAQNGQDHIEAQGKLERAAEYLNSIRVDSELDTPEDEILSASMALLLDTAEQLTECDCGGQFVDRHSYEYFEPAWTNYFVPGKSPVEDAISARDYCWQDFERMESLESGDWHYMGIRASANIQMANYPIQTLSSGGLWGIESDQSHADFEETESEELSQLREVLIGVGFSRRAIATAFKSIERKDA